MKIHEKNLKEVHLDDYQAAVYLDYLLSSTASAPAEKILNHVESCPACRDKILDLVVQMKKIKSPAARKPMPAVLFPVTAERTRNSWNIPVKQIAASIFIFAFMFTLYITVIRKNLLQPPTEIRPASGTGQGQTDLSQHSTVNTGDAISEPAPPAQGSTGEKPSGNTDTDFIVNANLELMINSQTRNENLKVISPENQAVFRNEIVFRWESFGIKPLQLKIMNNRNETLFEYSIQHDDFVFREQLTPGLYYWKLENRNDLLHVGKFLIKKRTIAQPE